MVRLRACHSPNPRLEPLRDGTGILQCVMYVKDVPPEVFARADHLPQETSLIVTGWPKAR